MEDDNLKQPGVLLDDRPESERIKDFKFEEIVASASPVVWKEKDPATLRRFPDQFQDGSGSCVAQTLKKIIGVYVFLKTKVFIKVSASHIYSRRKNRPSGGMQGNDAFKIAQKGVTLEDFAPSEKLNDAGMDAVEVNTFEEKIGEIFKLGSFLEVAPKNIDTIASIIQETGKAVMVWFYFTSEEWKANKNGEYTVPEVKTDLSGPSDPRSSRHSVAAIEFFLFKGKKALWIEDSSPFGGVSRRIVTEEYFKARNFYAAHFMNFAFEDKTEAIAIPKPKYTFTKDLEFTTDTTKIDTDVKALQDILKYEGLFPSNVESTGYFGAMTKAAVGKWQILNHVLFTATDPGFGRVGPKTRERLNGIYS